MYCKINSPKHHITLLLNILIVKKIKKYSKINNKISVKIQQINKMV